MASFLSYLKNIAKSGFKTDRLINITQSLYDNRNVFVVLHASA